MEKLELGIFCLPERHETSGEGLHQYSTKKIEPNNLTGFEKLLGLLK